MAHPDIILQPIGRVLSSRADVRDDQWDREDARIELDPERFDDDALRGLEAFSHVEVLFLMHRVDPANIESRARRPRNNPDWPEVGIFAQRGKNRPNRIGLTVCRVIGVAGRTLRVAGLDAVDGTPVLDLKPWMKEFAPRGDTYQPDWVDALMADYW